MAYHPPGREPTAAEFISALGVGDRPPRPRVTVQFDVDRNRAHHLQEVMDVLARRGGRVEGYRLAGPGGNPSFVVSIPGGHGEAAELLTAIHGIHPQDAHIVAGR